MRGQLAFDKLIKEYLFKTVLDWGCGVDAPHKMPFIRNGKDWYGFDSQKGWDDLGFTIRVMPRKFDCVWCSHVLEHLYNPVATLADFRKQMDNGGVLAVTVPPLKHEIVGGHINLYNMGLLIYQLVLAGWDCKEAKGISDGYDISVIVQRTPDFARPALRNDEGDIELLAPWLPEGMARQGFNGNISELNWR